jgi:hypothetical protein
MYEPDHHDAHDVHDVHDVHEVRYEEPVHAVERHDGLVGYAAIKYTAIVIIVLGILAFLGWYLVPAITGH